MEGFNMLYVIWLDGVLFYQTKVKEDAENCKRLLEKLEMNFSYEERLL